MNFSLQNIISTISLVAAVALAVGMLYLYKELSVLRETGTQGIFSTTQALVPGADKPAVAAPVVAEELLEEALQKEAVTKRQRWTALQSEYRDAVVQVFSQVNEFNWIEPYKAPNQSEKSGTGFFLNKEGDILTNAHVVDQAIYVTIQIPFIGKRRYATNVIAVNPERDLALLRLRPDDKENLKKALRVTSFPHMKMGNSDQVLRGDKLMALGYPLGQQGLKSTTGVASGRENLMGQYFIQISAPINPGNSGGPSVDNVGRVIGVNTRGIPSAQNIGYIIPVNEVLLFLEQVRQLPADAKPQLIKKPYLGVFFNQGNDNLTAFLKNPAPGGLYVVDVSKGSPFDNLGIKAGDMIYKIDGHPVDIYGEMSVPWSKEDRISIVDYVSRLKMGHTINLEYYRMGALKKVSLKLSPTESPVRMMYPGYEKVDYEVLGGYVFMPLTLNHVLMLAQYAPELVPYADSKKQTEPVIIITHVMLNSPASRTRTVGAGGIISEVNGKKVKSLNEFRSAAALSKKTGYLTLKTTDNQFVALPLSEILEDEPRLASTYNYKPSVSYQDLADK